MKTISVLGLAAALGLTLAASAQAQPVHRLDTGAHAVQTLQLGGGQPAYSALSDAGTRAAFNTGSGHSEAWQGAGLGGNPNGN